MVGLSPLRLTSTSVPQWPWQSYAMLMSTCLSQQAHGRLGFLILSCLPWPCGQIWTASPE